MTTKIPTNLSAAIEALRRASELEWGTDTLLQARTAALNAAAASVRAAAATAPRAWRAAYRLAHRHGHAWSDAGEGEIAGIMTPSLRHTTCTGVTSWVIAHDGRSITITRRLGGEIISGVVVVTATLDDMRASGPVARLTACDAERVARIVADFRGPHPGEHSIAVEQLRAIGIDVDLGQPDSHRRRQ